MNDVQLDTVRDALGLVRLLCVAAHDAGDQPRAAAFGLLGGELSNCYTLMSRCGPGSAPYGSSVGRADAALARLAQVPGVAGPLVVAARARLQGRGRERVDGGGRGGRTVGGPAFRESYRRRTDEA